jgi:DNA-directed RNA polymerase subunit RPC12/RpoP
MKQVREHDSGAEEWHCPTCGRRFIVQWKPNYKKITLVEGDVEAVHSGGKGGIMVGGTRIDVDNVWNDAIDGLDLSGL